MAMVPLLAFPKVNRSATVYDRSIDRLLFRESGFAISRVCAGTGEKTMTVKERQRMTGLVTASVNRSDIETETAWRPNRDCWSYK